MKKSMFMVSLAALALTSCSQDEVLDVQKDAITFATVADNASRANITTTANISSFKVWGIAEQNSTLLNYMNGVEYTDVTESNRSNYDSGYYWPTGTMDFYAVSPVSSTANDIGTPTVNINGTTVTATIADVEIGKKETSTELYDATAQTDLLYALATDEVKQTTAVPLNFHHALSQVVFKVKIADNVNQKIKVTVNGVTIKNLVNKGTYKLPSATTKNTKDTDGNVTNYGTNGSWSNSTETTDVHDFIVRTTNTVIDNYTVGTDNALSNNVTEETTSMLLLPQSLNASTYSNNAWTDAGLFILDTQVDALIDDDNDGVYGEAGETIVNLVNEPTYVPVNISWQEGKKYVYTFVYSANGNGGKTDDNQDQLVPIKFELTVDDFVESATEILNPVSSN